MRTAPRFSLVLVALCIGSVQGATLTFEGLQNAESPQQFYNGGTGSLGSGPGPNYGISFGGSSRSLLAFIDSDAGGTGDFGGEPSPSTALRVQIGSGVAASINVPVGFNSLSFYYSAPGRDYTISLWEGTAGLSRPIAVVTLPGTPLNGAPDPTGVSSPLVPFSISFPDTARSIFFSNQTGFDRQIYFDDITIGTVPEPGTATLLSLSVLLFAVWHRKQLYKRT